MPSEEALIKALAAAKKKLARCAKTWSRDTKGKYVAAYQEVLEAERALASERGEPHAIPIEFPLKWDIGAPAPLVVMSDYRKILIFRLNEPDPNWDGTYVHIVDTYAPIP
ncbi:MAG: hypothetical protein KDC35_17370 [Acidobacteria bacterium]|nr:hypothetical protein [Acidobacteriota bacterium]